MNSSQHAEYIPYEAAHSFDRIRTSIDEDPTQRLPHTTDLNINDYDPFFGLPLEDVFTDYGSDLRSSLHLGASRPNQEEYLVGQPEPTEESDHSSALRFFDEWLQPDPDFSVDVGFAQNYGFNHSNHPSFSLFDPPLPVQGTTATTPSSSIGTSNGSINSDTVGSFLSSSSPFTPGSSSSTNLSPGTIPIFTEPPGAPPSLKGAPKALQPKRGPQCPACQKLVSCSALLRSHQCNTNRVLCHFEGCKRGPKGFTSQRELDRHQNTVHADKVSAPSKLRVCRICQYNSRRKDHFERHEKSHQKKEERKKRGKN